MSSTTDSTTLPVRRTYTHHPYRHIKKTTTTFTRKPQKDIATKTDATAVVHYDLQIQSNNTVTTDNHDFQTDNTEHTDTQKVADSDDDMETCVSNADLASPEELHDENHDDDDSADKKSNTTTNETQQLDTQQLDTQPALTMSTSHSRNSIQKTAAKANHQKTNQPTTKKPPKKPAAKKVSAARTTLATESSSDDDQNNSSQSPSWSFSLFFKKTPVENNTHFTSRPKKILPKRGSNQPALTTGLSADSDAKKNVDSSTVTHDNVLSTHRDLLFSIAKVTTFAILNIVSLYLQVNQERHLDGLPNIIYLLPAASFLISYGFADLQTRNKLLILSTGITVFQLVKREQLAIQREAARHAPKP